MKSRTQKHSRSKPQKNRTIRPGESFWDAFHRVHGNRKMSTNVGEVRVETKKKD
jgi:hypothetical protein